MASTEPNDHCYYSMGTITTPLYMADTLLTVSRICPHFCIPLYLLCLLFGTTSPVFCWLSPPVPCVTPVTEPGTSGSRHHGSDCPSALHSHPHHWHLESQYQATPRLLQSAWSITDLAEGVRSLPALSLPKDSDGQPRSFHINSRTKTQRRRREVSFVKRRQTVRVSKIT